VIRAVAELQAGFSMQTTMTRRLIDKQGRYETEVAVQTDIIAGLFKTKVQLFSIQSFDFTKATNTSMQFSAWQA
jgi:hypothetical protein